MMKRVFLLEKGRLMRRYWLAVSLFCTAIILTSFADASSVCYQQCNKACYQKRAELIKVLEKKAHIQVAELIGKNIVIIPSDDLFMQKAEKLTPIGQKKLQLVMQYLRTFYKGEFTIAAYTDKTLPYDLRTQLSDRQARLVAGYLWSNEIPAGYQRVKYGGLAGRHPVDNNNDYLGTAENRRVEITIDPHCAKSGKGYVK